MKLSENNVVKDSILFSGISPDEIEQLIIVLKAGKRRYQKGSYLISAGDPISVFGLLLSGAVQISMDDLDGHHIVMANVLPGATFAEAMVCSNVAESPICACATQDSSVLWFHGSALLSPTFYSDPLCARFGTNFIHAMADRSLRFNDRIQVLSKKSIREKLITFFSQQVYHQKSRNITLSMDRSAFADYLGVERTALSRELSKMRKAGMIDFHKNQFTLHHG